MITREDLKRYIQDRHAFRREQVILPNGSLYGEAEEGWQREHVWGPLDARNGGNAPKHHLTYLELARGHAKSTMASMGVITSGILEDRLEVFFFAGDTEQAGICLTTLTGMIKANPDISQSFKVGKTEITVPSTGTIIKVMASDSDTAFGIGGTAKGLLVVCDEMWVWMKPDLWEAIISSTGKVGDSWRVLVLSNAGIDGESQVAWKVREACRTQADPSFYFWRSPGCIAGWITEAWKAQQRTLLTPGATPGSLITSGPPGNPSSYCPRIGTLW
ncbi:MAG: terminase large subunit [Dehalococcoidia bacterium]